MEENQDFNLLPPYLVDSDGAQSPESQTQRTYGTLSYNARRKCWTVKGDPMVTELCKRLFPGSATARRGEARFTAHRRVVGDLNWLMLRRRSAAATGFCSWRRPKMPRHWSRCSAGRWMPVR